MFFIQDECAALALMIYYVYIFYAYLDAYCLHMSEKAFKASALELAIETHDLPDTLLMMLAPAPRCAPDFIRTNKEANNEHSSPAGSDRLCPPSRRLSRPCEPSTQRAADTD